MKRFQKILVPIDTRARRHAALDAAVRLAEHSGARLKLIDIVSELPPQLCVPSYGYPALSDTLAKEKRRRLEALVRKLHGRGLAVDADVFYGKPFIEIIREVLRTGHDLVMKDAERVGRSRLFGTTDMRLYRKCPSPVWIVRPTRARRRRRILAAVDPATDPRHAERLNLKILELASSLAVLEEGELHVIHAWNSIPGEWAEGLRADMQKKVAREAKSRARSMLDSLLSSVDSKIAKNRIHLLEGEPGPMICDFANKLPADILVMGTVVRTGIEGFFIGNTAERILGQVRCSVLAVKPDGFVSPVKLRG